MIERCNYCGNMLETEPDGPIILAAQRVKVCPDIPRDEIHSVNFEAWREHQLPPTIEFEPSRIILP